MAERLVQKIALEIDAGSATTTFNLDAIDLSHADALTARLHISTIGTDAGDTFNCYLAARRDDGIWEDRAAWPQFLGNASDDEVYDMVIQQFGALDTTEEAHEPQGSAGGSRLTAGTVQNGPFPGVYRAGVTNTSGDPATNAAAASWRFQIVTVDADSDAVFTGTLYLYANTVG